MKKSMLIILLLFAMPSQAATYYLDAVDGNDANNGLSIGEAWQNIYYAQQNAPNSSTIYLLGGQYDSANGWIDRNQVALRNSPRTKWADAITFAPYDSCSPVIEHLFFEADTTTSHQDAYIIFDGLTFEYPNQGDVNIGANIALFEDESDSCIKVLNCTLSAAYLGQDANGQEWQERCVEDLMQIGRSGYGGVNDVTITNCTIYNSGQNGIRVAGNLGGNILINNCNIYNCGHTPLKLEGISLVGSRIDVNDNLLHSNVSVWVLGHTTTHHSSGVYIKCDNVTMERNKIYSEGGSGLLRIAQETDPNGRQNLTFRNNLFYDPKNSIHTNEGYDLGTNIIFNNNTMICTHSGRDGVNYYEMAWTWSAADISDANTWEICNNIFVGYVAAPPAECNFVGNIMYAYIDSGNWRDQTWMNANRPGNTVYNSDNTAPYDTDGQEIIGMGGVASGTLFKGGTVFDANHCTRGYHPWGDDGNASSIWFHGLDMQDSYSLKAGSPAIGYADPAYAPATDILGVARDASPDAGCYEYVAGDPTVDTLSPADNSTQIAITANLVITFSEAVDAESGNINLYETSGDTLVQAFDVTSDISGTGTATITANPTSDLKRGNAYYVKIDASAFDDAADNSYAGIADTTTWNFTTIGVGQKYGTTKTEMTIKKGHSF